MLYHMTSDKLSPMPGPSLPAWGTPTLSLSWRQLEAAVYLPHTHTQPGSMGGPLVTVSGLSQA
jgi:hypothetical protein